MTGGILEILAPLIIWGIKIFFKSDADKDAAVARFQKYVASKKEYAAMSKKVKDSYKEQMAEHKKRRDEELLKLKQQAKDGKNENDSDNSST